MRKIPYGLSNFETLIKENYLYVDKTKYIEILEKDAPYQFFIRPRRFGKSLFLSMLENYYDINKEEKFEQLFGSLYIGKNPTDKRNSYLVLYINFSNLVVSEGKERFIGSFDQCVMDAALSFLDKYSNLFDGKVLPEDRKGAETILSYITTVTGGINKRVFIIIDEYDNFANDLISAGNKKLYYEIISSEGYVRTFYKTIKTGTAFSVERVFMTGVSPIMLDDLTSGFNITKNLTLNPKYNEMLGFTEVEVNEIISELSFNIDFDEKHLKKTLKEYYNGYLFSAAGKERVYNSNMIFYFFDAAIDAGKYPESLMDENIKTDYNRLKDLAFNFKNEESIEKLLSGDSITTKLVEKFNLERMYDKKENFISLLYYLGMLTIEEAIFDKYKLKVPNYAVRTVYWEYFTKKLEEKNELIINDEMLSNGIQVMAVEGKVDIFAQYLSNFMSILSNRDLIQFDEKHIKMILISLFMNGIYIVNSEIEVESGYIDLLLSCNKAYEKYINYEWIIELKYVKEGEKVKFEMAKKQGLEQLRRYGESEKVKGIFNGREIKKLLLIFKGKTEIEFVIVEE